MTITCPDCRGDKVAFAFINTGENWRSHQGRHIDCTTCAGTGEVDDGYLDRLAAGRFMRDQRIKRGESLTEAAKRTGMKPSELSDLERGKLPRRKT